MEIRRFLPEEAEEVSELVIRTLRTTSIRDYSAEYIERIVAASSPEKILERASWTHFYVALDGGRIVGCGAIGPYEGREDESCLYMVFVAPEYQWHGVGRKIIEALEQDEWFLRADRIEVPASITAVPFYLKLGYDYKTEVREPDEEGLLHLEKRRN